MTRNEKIIISMVIMVAACLAVDILIDLHQERTLIRLEQAIFSVPAPNSPQVGITLPKPRQEAKRLKSNVRRFKDLLDAIEIIESGGDCNAVGDNGRAVGAYQIHLCYLEDANKQSWHKIFTENDRYDRQKSREMVRLYMDRYATYGRLGREPTLEDMARIHNGGANGYKKESTKAYWQKIKRVLREQ